MTQIFFVSPTGIDAPQALAAGRYGITVHCWVADGTSSPAICVVHIFGAVDTEKAAHFLETHGMLLLPDHRFSGQVGASIATALTSFGVLSTDTCTAAMNKVRAISGCDLHKPRRYA